MMRVRADAYNALDAKLLKQSLFDKCRCACNNLRAFCRGERLDDDDVGLIDAEDKILLLIGEELLYRLDCGDIGSFHLAHEQDAARLVRDEMQLLRADIDVAGEDIVGDNVLYEGGLVVLLLVIALSLVEGYCRDGAERPRNGVAAVHKRGKVKS